MYVGGGEPASLLADTPRNPCRAQGARKVEASLGRRRGSVCPLQTGDGVRDVRMDLTVQRLACQRAWWGGLRRKLKGL